MMNLFKFEGYTIENTLPFFNYITPEGDTIILHRINLSYVYFKIPKGSKKVICKGYLIDYFLKDRQAAIQYARDYIKTDAWRNDD